MTISTTETRKLYNGDGATTSFIVTFDFDNESEIQVDVINISTNAVTSKILNTDYTVSGSNVVFTAPPSSSEKVLLTYNLNFEQSTDLSVGGLFSAGTIENSFDELAKQIKQIKAQIDYNVPKLPSNLLDTSTVTDSNILANYAFTINDTGDGLDLQNITSLIDLGTLSSGSLNASDLFLYSDISDSGTLKKATLQTLLDFTKEGTLVSLIAGENINAGQPVYVHTDGKIYKTDITGTVPQAMVLGTAQSTVTTGNSAYVKVSGVDSNQSGLTVGSTYYLSQTAGSITTTPPNGSANKLVRLGVAVSSSELQLNPQFICVRAS